jgi:hypothetical protein
MKENDSDSLQPLGGAGGAGKQPGGGRNAHCCKRQRTRRAQASNRCQQKGLIGDSPLEGRPEATGGAAERKLGNEIMKNRKNAAVDPGKNYIWHK